MAWPLVPRDAWATMSTAQRLVALSNRSLDECLDILEIPLDECENNMLNAKVQTIRAILTTCARLGIEASRAAGERERILAEMARDIRKREKLE